MGKERKNNKEWSNEYSGFNDWKILGHYDHLKKIQGWYEGKNELPPPIAVDTDPGGSCQQTCVFCNTKAHRNDVSQNIPKEHLLNLAFFYKNWGVKSTCVAGGLEPLVNPAVKEFLPLLKKLEVESSMITNGIGLTEEISYILSECSRFCGISFDGICPETYKKIRGIDTFNKVLTNIKNLNKIREKTNSTLDVNIKTLIHPYNYKELFETAVLAKEIGCSGIHIRPAALEDVPMVYNPMEETNFNLKEYNKIVNEQIEKCFSLESENFKVYAVKHKFGENLKKTVKFSKCLTTPVAGVFGADGIFHLCFSRRGIFKLGNHYPDPENIAKLWGSEQHRKLIESINPDSCCRCAFTRYNEVIENCILQDKIFKNFL